MNRRSFFALPAAGAAATLKAAPACRVLAQDYRVVAESPDAATCYLYSPGIARLDSGRLIATWDMGFLRDGRKLEMQGGIPAGKDAWWGRIALSDDRGNRWREVTRTPMRHARPFLAGKSLYVLGHSGDLIVVRSDDAGASWSPPVKLTEGQTWHQAPCNVWYANRRVYLVMERQVDTAFRGWAVPVLAPVVLSAPVDADLTLRGSWTFSNEFTFRDAVAQAGTPRGLGVPFFNPGPQTPGQKDQRSMSEPGWLETNIVRIEDPNHVWYDPSGRSFLLLMRAHTGLTNLACIARATESEDRRAITVGVEHAPSGEPMLYVPCPGGQMKFHVLYDAPSKLYWLLSSQATDSMTAPAKLGPDRYNLPNNERHRLALHFSRNCVDWCFAGMVAASGTPRQGRHYASMVVDGPDLQVLSRSGDARAASAHDGNLITLHTVPGFRSLVY